MASPRPSLLHHADFRKLWVAETVSQFGTQVSLLAIPIIAAVVLKVPADQFALLGFFEFLPFILISLPAGVWVDRLRRRPILILGDLGRAASLLSIPIAYELGVLTIYQLYVVGFVNGILTVFFDVSYQSYLPSLVDRVQIVEGNSKLETSRSAAQIVGPGFGGVLIGLVGPALAVIADAASFVASAGSVFLIRRAEPPPEVHPEGQRPSMVREAKAGFGYVVRHPYLRMIAAATASSNLFSNILFSILILYLVQTLLLTPAQIGLVFGLGSIGTLVGAVTANRVARLIGVGPAIVISIMIEGPAMILIAIAPANGTAIPFLVASGFVGGISQLVYNINQVSFRQAITPPRMQGRMNASMRFIVWGTIPPGQILGGLIAAHLGGLTTAIWVGAIGSCVPFLFVLLSPVRTLREMPEPVDDDGAAAVEVTGGEGAPASPEAAHGPTRPEMIGEAMDESARRAGSATPLARIADED